MDEEGQRARGGGRSDCVIRAPGSRLPGALSRQARASTCHPRSRSVSTGRPVRPWDASLPSGAVTKHVEGCIPPMGGGDKARGGGHGCTCMDAPLPWGRSRMHVHGCTPPMEGPHGCTCMDAPLPWGRSRMHLQGCIPPMGAVTDAPAGMHPSHGRSSRMQVHGCTPPMEGPHGRTCMDAPLPLGGGPEARRGTHSSRMRGPRCTMGALIPHA